MICIDGGRHTVYIASPFNTRLVYCQQFFLTTPIVAFRRSVLAAMIRQRVETIIILLQQHSTSCITTCIRINDEGQFEVRQAQDWWVT